MSRFSAALQYLQNNPNSFIRLPTWKDDVKIKLQIVDAFSKMTAPYLYVDSRFGRVPWLPTQIEILSDQWEMEDE